MIRLLTFQRMLHVDHLPPQLPILLIHLLNLRLQPIDLLSLLKFLMLSTLPILQFSFFKCGIKSSEFFISGLEREDELVLDRFERFCRESQLAIVFDHLGDDVGEALPFGLVLQDAMAHENFLDFVRLGARFLFFLLKEDLESIFLFGQVFEEEHHADLEVG